MGNCADKESKNRYCLDRKIEEGWPCHMSSRHFLTPPSMCAEYVGGSVDACMDM